MIKNKNYKKISIVIACYNEELNIIPMYEQLLFNLEPLGYELEIIYVDNHSGDGSEVIYNDLAAKDKRVKVIFMSRNFGGPQTSYFAGMKLSSGDAVILIDGDIQDPPELLPKLIEKWEEGYEVVYGVRKKRRGRLVMRVAYKMFYRLFNKLAYIDIPLDAGEFGLMARNVVDELISFPENEVLIRGLRAYIGFKQTGIEYTRNDRTAGTSKTSFFKDLGWAKKFIVNFSYEPLRWISYFAFVASLVAAVGLVINLILFILDPSSPGSGTPTIIFAILFLGGAQMLALSIIGEYLGRVFQEVKRRPQYIVKKILNDEKPKKDK